jgi:sec-independent protein translocase protein TatA
MFGLGVPELVVLGIIILVLFGSRLPSAMRALGGSFHSFKKGMEEGAAEDQKLESKDS